MDIKKFIKDFVLENEKDLIAFRRELHQHPELSMQEFETTKRVAKRLDEEGIEYRLTEPTGIIAEIKGDHPGKTVLLRADMDALPIYEQNRDLEYCSQNDGVMHACGHDTHTAMLLFAAKALNKMKSEIHGTVRLVFQPAEERATGALCMVEQGAADGIDNAFGIHIWTATPSHQVDCPVGEMMAAADLFDVKFTGRGGHGSRPNEAIDAIVMASSFVMNAQSIVSREMNPLNSAVVTIGTFNAGDAFNIIAHDATLTGTVRIFNQADRKLIESALKRYADSIAQMYGGTVEFNYNYGTEPVINDKQSAELVRDIVIENFGEEAMAAPTKTCGGEDFSYFGMKAGVPSTFVFLGTRNSEKATDYEHHHAKFNIDEDTLKNGVILYCNYAIRYLAQDKF